MSLRETHTTTLPYLPDAAKLMDIYFVRLRQDFHHYSNAVFQSLVGYVRLAWTRMSYDRLGTRHGVNNIQMYLNTNMLESISNTSLIIYYYIGKRKANHRLRLIL